jgi:hypothetical protein
LVVFEILLVKVCEEQRCQHRCCDFGVAAYGHVRNVRQVVYPLNLDVSDGAPKLDNLTGYVLLIIVNGVERNVPHHPELLLNAVE